MTAKISKFYICLEKLEQALEIFKITSTKQTRRQKG